MENTNEIPKFKEWCVVELMGHVRMAGLVTEVELFGSKQGRIDIPMEMDSSLNISPDLS